MRVIYQYSPLACQDTDLIILYQFSIQQALHGTERNIVILIVWENMAPEATCANSVGLIVRESSAKFTYESFGKNDRLQPSLVIAITGYKAHGGI